MISPEVEGSRTPDCHTAPSIYDLIGGYSHSDSQHPHHFVFLESIFIFIYLGVFVCHMCVCVYVYVEGCPKRPEEVTRVTGAGVMGGCEPPVLMWVLRKEPGSSASTTPDCCLSDLQTGSHTGL